MWRRHTLNLTADVRPNRIEQIDDWKKLVHSASNH